jgi:tRNA-Thr(GGU) m(6)t(6)A37 methyltransferase TsaA
MARKVPAGWRAVTPRIVVDDVGGLAAFVRDVFGATGDVMEERPTVMTIGDARIMISGTGPRPATPAFLYVYVDDADATYRRAVAAGARTIEEPLATEYGDRRAMVEDAWGNAWQIATSSRAAPAPFELRPIGVVRSSITTRSASPRQGAEGAPDAWLELDADMLDGLDGLRVGEDVVLITWLHLGDRDTLKVHPRNDPSRYCGVFATRSPDRPNPLGLHRVTVRAIEGTRLLVGPLEVIEGTPIVDLKITLSYLDDA